MNNLTLAGEELHLLRDARRRPGRLPRRRRAERDPRRDVEHAEHAGRGAGDRVPAARPGALACAAAAAARARTAAATGIVREIEALAPMRFTLITERRRHAPRGREGGADGEPRPQPAERRAAALQGGGRAAARRPPAASRRRAGGGYGAPVGAYGLGQAVSLAPVAERGHELLLGLGRDATRPGCARGRRSSPHLLDVERAGVALGDVLLEPGPGVRRPCGPRDSRSPARPSPGRSAFCLRRAVIEMAPSGCGFKCSSSAARTFERARCRSTLWFVSLRSSALRTSSAAEPLMSRSAITSRWRGGRSLIASSSTRASRSPPAGSCGSSHATGGLAHQRRAFATRALEPIRVERRASPPPRARRRSRANGQEPRRSRVPRVRALLRAMLASQVREHRATLEPVEAVERGKPRVLDHLLGDRPARHVHHHQAHEERPVLLDQGPERVLVSAAEPLEQALHRGRPALPRPPPASRLPPPASVAILSCATGGVGSAKWRSGWSSTASASPTRSGRARSARPRSSSSTVSVGRSTPGGRSSPPARSAAGRAWPTTSAAPG